MKRLRRSDRLTTVRIRCCCRDLARLGSIRCSATAMLCIGSQTEDLDDRLWTVPMGQVLQ
ncbi:MAG: hypothetical protein HY815_09470 [Candidatus Riflebacteria bacterium]|nr:hypothetical protein [Candidatus Riflebacteria bacterium]